jgi:hypothetical protein
MSDVFFECLSSTVDQLGHSDTENNQKHSDNISTVKSLIGESRVIAVLAKFTGFIYFLPYRDSKTTEALSCVTHRKCPLDLAAHLMKVKSPVKLAFALNWITEFIYQSNFREDQAVEQAVPHLQEFELLGNYCNFIISILNNFQRILHKMVLYSNLMTIIECIPQRSFDQMDFKNIFESDEEPVLTQVIFLVRNIPSMHIQRRKVSRRTKFFLWPVSYPEILISYPVTGNLKFDRISGIGYT